MLHVTFAVFSQSTHSESATLISHSTPPFLMPVRAEAPFTFTSPAATMHTQISNTSFIKRAAAGLHCRIRR